MTMPRLSAVLLLLLLIWNLNANGPVLAVVFILGMLFGAVFMMAGAEQ